MEWRGQQLQQLVLVERWGQQQWAVVTCLLARDCRWAVLAPPAGVGYHPCAAAAAAAAVPSPQGSPCQV
jgi:hypothetical protein